MTLTHTILVGLSLLVSAAPFADVATPALVSATQPVPAVAPLPTPIALTWTADTQSWTGGDWNGGVQAAANHTEGGFTDWRLPTVAELQAALQIPDGQPGSWGRDFRNPGGTARGWTSRSQGNYAYAVTIVTDATGVVVATPPTGTSTKLLKASNLARTKFVRP